MRKYLSRLFPKLFCLHDWEGIDKVEIYGRYSLSVSLVRQTNLYKCRKCGKFRKIKM
jgi:hypothetical protein